ncbi:MAG: hypothetical protein IPN97_02890 [Saprospiraceae bacterium]|nr:hypothetical protein [Saprospiraceae bacterium]
MAQRVGILNEQNVLYIENRNGNSDAKAFQLDTLERMFQHLKDNNISRIDKFRADAYQYDVEKLVEKNVTSFYIGHSYVENILP